MKTKLTLLAAVILAGVGTSIALDTATPATDKPAGMSCCAKMPKAPAPAADKDAPATTGMSCHSDAPAAKDAAPVKAKGCCK
jgi:hypothetical protein